MQEETLKVHMNGTIPLEGLSHLRKKKDEA